VKDPDTLHRGLVDGLVRRRLLASPRLEAAFRSVPRHRFLPGVPPEEAYRDAVIVTKVEDGVPVSASSQPSFMAVMLAQLALAPGDRVLEIGTGTGYNAALMAEVVGPTGHVVSVDLDGAVVEQARGCLDAVGYRSVEVVHGDGALGHAAAAPYDRVIVTVGAWDIPPALREQVRPGGRLVIPLSVRGPQRSIAFERVGALLVGKSMADCDFSTSLRGDFAGPPKRLRIPGQDGVSVWFDGARDLDPATIARQLSASGADRPSGHAARVSEIFGGLYLWLALNDARFVQVGWAGMAKLPCVLWLPGKLSMTAGLLDASGLALLGVGDRSAATSLGDPRWLPVCVRGFDAGAGLVDRLVDLVSGWNDAGRPGTEGLRVTARPIDERYDPAAGEFIVDKRWSRLVLSW
jgi:protein-L-isoaspartate(D-aspartate) O-methyltransferase